MQTDAKGVHGLDKVRLTNFALDPGSKYWSQKIDIYTPLCVK